MLASSVISEVFLPSSIWDTHISLAFSYTFVFNCSKGFYCTFSNFSPSKSFYNDLPILPKCEIRTYPYILLSTPHIRLFWFHKKRKLVRKNRTLLRTKSKKKYPIWTNYHSCENIKKCQKCQKRCCHHLELQFYWYIVFQFSLLSCFSFSSFTALPFSKKK